MFAEPSLFRVPKEVSTRWASPENWSAGKGAACEGGDGRKRSAYFSLKAGESRTLAEIKGTSGILRRIWITVNDRSPAMLRGLRLEMFWDGAEKPAVCAPLGDFFMHGLGRMCAFENALFSSPEGRSFNCYAPMPFRKMAKVVLTNESPNDMKNVFFDINFTTGDKLSRDDLYFHAHWRRENPTRLMKDYEILPKINGKGRFLGSNIGVAPDKGTYFLSWWGEGEVKMFIDGDSKHPSLCGTGTEDYIGTGWGQGQYTNLFQGCHLADKDKVQYCLYRLHIPDPVYFHKGVRVTIQQIGWGDTSAIAQMKGCGTCLRHGEKPLDMDKIIKEKGNSIFERSDDWSSCAYFYLDKPENGLPEIAPFDERAKGLL